MNWKLLIADLKTRGWTETQMAGACGCSQGTISALSLGTNVNPLFSTGDKLRALHERICIKCKPVQPA